MIVLISVLSGTLLLLLCTKKRTIVSSSSALDELCVMAVVIVELTWLR